MKFKKLFISKILLSVLSSDILVVVTSLSYSLSNNVNNSFANFDDKVYSKSDNNNNQNIIKSLVLAKAND